uniref:Uncharacterized protein n=1 Tax=Arsenophonus nasoniae TaxID=638 RepID=D2TZB5_9GAMM|nr:hypothetical protein ARN_15240 [Arsenophonus nasoniae]
MESIGYFYTVIIIRNYFLNFVPFFFNENNLYCKSKLSYVFSSCFWQLKNYLLLYYQYQKFISAKKIDELSKALRII